MEKQLLELYEKYYPVYKEYYKDGDIKHFSIVFEDYCITKKPDKNGFRRISLFNFKSFLTKQTLGFGFSILD